MTVESILSSISGGALIGLAAALLAICLNRVAGISGIAAALLEPRLAESRWRFWFILGLFFSAPLYRLIGEPLSIQLDTSLPLLTVAGLLVGYGSRLGGGCTSGHGICGIARLSLRSIAATLVFMSTAVVTVFTVRHLL